MTRKKWYTSMNIAGWFQHVTGTGDNLVTVWRHKTSKRANGDAQECDEATAELHRLAGTTPPPF